MYPQQPPPVQYYAPPVAAPRKRRGCWVVLALLVVLGCCLAAIVVVGYLVYDNMDDLSTGMAESSDPVLPVPTASAGGQQPPVTQEAAEPPRPEPTGAPMTFRFEQVVEFTNDGPETVDRFEIWQGLPLDHSPFQKALSYDLPDVAYTIQDGVDGSRMAYLNQEGLWMQPGDVFTYSLQGEVMLYPDRLDLPTTCSGELPQEYLQPEEYAESGDPRIQQIAADLSAGKPDDCARVKAFYDYAKDNIEYVYYAEDRGALTALETGEGDCTDISFLMIALSRAAGIPARRVQGFNLNPGEEEGTFVFDTHQWAEVYLPGTGWIPADPTYGQNEDVPYTYLGGYLQDHILLNIDDFNFSYTTWSETGDNTMSVKVSVTGGQVQ